MLQIAFTCLVLAAEPAAPAAAEPSPAPAAAAPAPAAPASAAPIAPAEPAAAPAAPAAVPEAAPAPQSAPPPAASPAPPAPVVEGPPAEPGEPLRFTASLGIGRAWPDGLVSSRVAMNDLTSATVGVRLDFGFRITQKWLVAVVVDAQAGGTPGAGYRLLCAIDGVDCAVTTFRAAVEGRYVFRPLARRTWWVGAGLGSEAAQVMLSNNNGTRPYLPTFTGGLLRLSAGWDRRINQSFGWGFYGGWSVGTYGKTRLGDSGPYSNVEGEARSHSWLDLGVRLILFP
jgi:hypothetical protein